MNDQLSQRHLEALIGERQRLRRTPPHMHTGVTLPNGLDELS
jgi:hypothetical protein